MSGETETQVTRNRRASDAEVDQRILTGWIGIGMAVLGFLAGLAMLVFERGSVVLAIAVLLGSFLAAMVAGNRLPFSAVASLIPKWGGRGDG